MGTLKHRITEAVLKYSQLIFEQNKDNITICIESNSRSFRPIPFSTHKHFGQKYIISLIVPIIIPIIHNFQLYLYIMSKFELILNEISLYMTF